VFCSWQRCRDSSSFANYAVMLEWWKIESFMNWIVVTWKCKWLASRQRGFSFHRLGPIGVFRKPLRLSLFEQFWKILKWIIDRFVTRSHLKCLNMSKVHVNFWRVRPGTLTAPPFSVTTVLAGQLSSCWDRRMAGRLFSSPDEFLVTSVMLGFNELWMERHSVLMKSATRNRVRVAESSL